MTFKATVEQAHLLKCLGRVHRVVERKNTIPILSNVLMQIEQTASCSAQRIST